MRVDGVADDGSRIAVDLPDDADLDELRRRWPPFGLRREAPVDEAVLSEAAQRTRLRPDPDTAAWDRLESDLGLFTVERLDGVVAVHAATLVVDDRALLLPGRSHAGKTTLAMALARAGATLASDEYALVDAAGRVSGWPRPARIREGTGSRRAPVAGRVHPVEVGLVALLRYDAACDEPVEVRPSTRADAVVAVLDETVCARSRPDASLDAALAITAGDVVRGRRGEAGEAAAWLLARARTAAPT